MTWGNREGRYEAMFWRAMRQALYEEIMNPPAPARPRAPKLQPAQVREIQARWAHGEKTEALAAEFGVCASAISYHVRGLPRNARAA